MSLVITDNQAISLLNANWRGKNQATDVLSFPLAEKFNAEQKKYLLLGDIVISGEKALEQAALYGHSPYRELAFLFVHGLLHLLGYDHNVKSEELVMRTKQREILAAGYVSVSKSH